VKVGDLVARTYGEGQRPIAIIVGFMDAGDRTAKILWAGKDKVDLFATKYLEIINESR